MIRINYWTSQYFEENVWDKFYCKNFASAKRKLKEVSERFNETTKEILKEYDKWVFDKKTCFSVWDANISNATLYILAEDIILD